MCTKIIEMSRDEEMQRPFWGFETWDLRTYFGLQICYHCFLAKDFGKDFCCGLSLNSVTNSFVCDCYNYHFIVFLKECSLRKV